MNVICAVDGSDAAPGVVRYAAGIASRAGLPLRIVRAVQVADPMFVTPGVVRALEDPAERRARIVAQAERQLERLAAEVRGVEVSHELRQGSPEGEVGAIVEQHRARLVVIGLGSKSGQRRGLGGTGQRIVRRSSCPVLVVPPGHDRMPGERFSIVVGLRGGEQSDASAILARARELAELVRAELVLAHSQREGAGAGPDWLEKVADGRPYVAAEGKPSRELLRIAAEAGADAIAVAPRGHGPLRQALFGSVSSELLSSGERPVFVIPRSHR